jgi:elongation factor Ts
MAITMDQIKELRKRTGVGITKVKEALTESNGDVDKAIQYLREKGLAKSASRMGRDANNGFIGHYIHADGTIGVIVEVNTETDFAARSEKLRELAHELALHIAANDPQYVRREEIPSEMVEKEEAVFKKDLEGKPEQVQEKILEGKMAKFYEDKVLLDQHFVRDDSKKVADLINEYIAAIGEKVEIGRFARIQIAKVSTSCGLEITN